LALQLAGDVLPASCQAAMVSSIALALDGEPADRVSPAYSNIAIMRAWLEVSGGAPIGRDDLVRRGVALGEAIASRFDEVGGLDEWNSPTYYGVDLYALALWRSSGLLSGLGARLEAALWRDLAPWYHPGLGNMCGPYTRAYGMDMHSYAAVLGFWIPGGRAVPDLETAFSHTHDLSMLPIAGLLGSSIPSDVDLVSFVGERRLERTITPSRVASGWLGPDVMIGGERGDRQMMCAGQYHAATVHWREGWVRVHHRGVVDATASPGGLSVVSRGSGRTSFVIGGGAVSVSASCWQLPGATVRVATNAGFGGFDRGRVRYDPPSGGGVATFELEVTTG
jgi:hypothetical protein